MSGPSGVAAAGGLFGASDGGSLLDVAASAESGEGVDGEVAGFAPLGGERADVLPEGGAVELFGGDEVAGLLEVGELGTINEGGLEPEFLCGDDGLNHGFKLALEVVGLVDHEGDIHGQAVGFRGVELGEDAEDLVGVDGAKCQIVIGIAAIVEVESAEHVLVEEPGDDLLDVLCVVVVAGVDEDFGLGTGGFGKQESHAPVGNVCVVEGRLEGLVFDQEALGGSELGVGGGEAFGEPVDALADGLGAGVVGAVGHPEGDVAGAELAGDGDGVEEMSLGVGADFRGGIAEGAEPVLLGLEEVGIDGAGLDAGFLGEFCDSVSVGDAVGEIPEDVEGHGGGGAGETEDFGTVGEFFLKGGGGGGLGELAEAGAGVGKAPGGDFDFEVVESGEGLVDLQYGCRHEGSSIKRRAQRVLSRLP